MKLEKVIRNKVAEEYEEIFNREIPEGVVEVVTRRAIMERGALPLEEIMSGVIHVALIDYYEEGLEC